MATPGKRANGELVIKRNYRQAKRQKEEARKVRQMQKQQRRSDRAVLPDATVATDSQPQGGEAVDPAPASKE